MVVASVLPSLAVLFRLMLLQLVCHSTANGQASKDRRDLQSFRCKIPYCFPSLAVEAWHCCRLVHLELSTPDLAAVLSLDSCYLQPQGQPWKEKQLL